MFGQRLKRIVKTALPKAFRDKVGYPPLRKWVHDIDVGDVKPLQKYGRPLTPVEHESIKKFVEDRLDVKIPSMVGPTWCWVVLIVY